MYTERVLPVSCLLEGGKSTAETNLPPQRNTYNVGSSAHMYFAYAELSSLKRHTTSPSSVPNTDDHSSNIKREDVVMDSPDCRFEMRLEFNKSAPLMSIPFDMNLSVDPATALKRINDHMLTESAYFEKSCLFVDWIDEAFLVSGRTPDNPDYDALVGPYLKVDSGYGVASLAKYPVDRLPPGANPYHLPPLTAANLRKDRLRLRLIISPGVRFSISNQTQFKHLGFHLPLTPLRLLRGELAVLFENDSATEWKSVVASAMPDELSPRISFRIDVEASSLVGEIRAYRNFKLSDAAARGDDSALLRELAAVASDMSKQTNVKSGVELDPSGRFRFKFPTNGRAAFSYGVSSNLASRLRASAVTITPATTFNPPSASTEAEATSEPEPEPESASEPSAAEALAANVIAADEAGLLYVCSPSGRSEFYPSKLLAILAPMERGGFKMIDSAFITSPFVCDSAFLNTLPAGNLTMRFYTQSVDGSFSPFAPPSSMKLQATIVWRTSAGET